jgi:FK506-binding nuclear protein
VECYNEMFVADNTDLSVVVNVDKNDYVLCTLSKQRIPQQMLDLNFQAGENIAFMTKGKGIVHLTGM